MSATSRTFEGSTRSSASPEQAWAVWTDPSAWPGGPIDSAKLHGSFEIGGKITTKVKGYPPGTSTIVLIDEPREWTGVAKTPGLTMNYEHVIEPDGTGCVLTERAIPSGLLGGIIARLLGRRLESTFIATTAHVSRLAEGRDAAAAAPG